MNDQINIAIIPQQTLPHIAEHRCLRLVQIGKAVIQNEHIDTRRRGHKGNA